MSVTSGGTAPNGCSAGGRSAGSAGSAGMVITLSAVQLVAVAVPAPHRRGQVLGRDHDADEPPRRVRVVGRAQLQHHLVLGAEVDASAGAGPSARSQKCSAWPYFWPSSSSGTSPSSIIDGVPHSLVISVFWLRCHQAS